MSEKIQLKVVSLEFSWSNASPAFKNIVIEAETTAKLYRFKYCSALGKRQALKTEEDRVYSVICGGLTIFSSTKTVEEMKSQLIQAYQEKLSTEIVELHQKAAQKVQQIEDLNKLKETERLV